MYQSDFYWTWDKTADELEAVFAVADALRDLRERNLSTHAAEVVDDMEQVCHRLGGVVHVALEVHQGGPLLQDALGVALVQGVHEGLLMDVTLAHPEGYEVMPEIEETAKKNAQASGGAFRKVSSVTCGPPR